MIPINDPARYFTNLLSGSVDLPGFISKGNYIGGEHLERFQNRFAEYLGVKFCIGVSSGTDALELALRSLEISQGKKVVLSGNNGGYASGAIHKLGLIPFYVDTDSNGLLDLTVAASTLDSSVGAVVITHLYGQTVNFGQFGLNCKRSGIPIIEDCAQSTGSRIDGRLSGTLGDISTFSFYPTKNLSTIGDAGAVCTSIESLATKVSMLREYGWSSKYIATLPGGGNHRMDNIHAVILEQALCDLDQRNIIRRRIWQRYKDSILHPNLELIGCGDDSFVAHLAVLRFKNRVKLEKHFNQLGIATAVHYPVLDHKQGAFLQEGEYFKVERSEQFVKEALTIPCFPEMTDHEISKVCHAIATFR